MKATIDKAGILNLSMNLLEAAKLHGVLPDGEPAKVALSALLAPPSESVSLPTLVKGWPWSGSHFPIDDCFNELKVKVPTSKHDELRRLISRRAKEHNACLE